MEPQFDCDHPRDEWTVVCSTCAALITDASRCGPQFDSNPYCTATTKDGRPCLAFHVSRSDRCAAHNTDSQHLRWLHANPGVIARLERERTSIIAQLDALNGRLTLIDNELTHRRNNVGSMSPNKSK